MRPSGRSASPFEVPPRGGGEPLEEGMLGLGIEGGGWLVKHQDQGTLAHEAAGQGKLLPLAEAHLHAFGPGWPELRLDAGRQPRNDVIRARPVDGGNHRGLVVEPAQIADSDGVVRLELEAEEVLKRAGEPRPPCLGGHAREIMAVDQDPAAGRLVESRQELHEGGLARSVFADDGHDRAGPEIQADILEHLALRAGIGERNVFEADALLDPLRNGHIGVFEQRSGVVLEPGQASRAIKPDAAQEADLADRGADVRREPRARREHEQDIAW